MKTNLSKTIRLLSLTFSLMLSACGAAAPESTAIAAATNTSIPPTFTPTITLTPTQTPTPTRTPDLTATQQYSDFLAIVQQAFEEGQISSTEGTYKTLAGFSDNLAMRYGYAWDDTGESPREFLLRADFSWEVANQKNYSGCGYMFRQESEDHYYLFALDALNGVFLNYTKIGLNEFGTKEITVHTSVRASKKESLPDLGGNPYQARVTLIVSETRMYTYINGEFYSEHRLPEDYLTEAGPLSYMVMTGSATDYGTRCTITNTELWEVQP